MFAANHRGAFVAACAAVLAIGLGFSIPRSPRPLRIEMQPGRILANGVDVAMLTIHSEERPTVTIPAHRGTVLQTERRGSVWVARIRAGVNPGAVPVRVSAPALQPITRQLYISAADPEAALQLDDAADRSAFRRWFTALAESQWFLSPAKRPAEIKDCAALIRYAYREALREHDDTWAASQHLPFLPPSDSVLKYNFPFTPFGAALFRVPDGSFAQFADAQTLQRENTFAVSRDIARAEPGDLLFFHHNDARQPFHAMIYLGGSQAAHDGTKYVVYHTGRGVATAGEIRRPTLGELQRHPDPSWHPAPENPDFLGVYRWNILKGSTS